MKQLFDTDNNSILERNGFERHGYNTGDYKDGILDIWASFDMCKMSFWHKGAKYYFFDGSVFSEEYFKSILKEWDNSKSEILEDKEKRFDLACENIKESWYSNLYQDGNFYGRIVNGKKLPAIIPMLELRDVDVFFEIDARDLFINKLGFEVEREEKGVWYSNDKLVVLYSSVVFYFRYAGVEFHLSSDLSKKHALIKILQHENLI